MEEEIRKEIIWLKNLKFRISIMRKAGIYYAIKNHIRELEDEN